MRHQEFLAAGNGVPDNAGTGGEFYVGGCGLAVDDLDVWSHVADAASYTPADRYILFEMQLSEARCHGYGDVPLPSTRRWSVDQ
jgi:hypothetical protein